MRCEILMNYAVRVMMFCSFLLLCCVVASDVRFQNSFHQNDTDMMSPANNEAGLVVFSIIKKCCAKRLQHIRTFDKLIDIRIVSTKGLIRLEREKEKLARNRSHLN